MVSKNSMLHIIENVKRKEPDRVSNPTLKVVPSLKGEGALLRSAVDAGASGHVRSAHVAVANAEKAFLSAGRGVVPDALSFLLVRATPDVLRHTAGRGILREGPRNTSRQRSKRRDDRSVRFQLARLGQLVAFRRGRRTPLRRTTSNR
jgi:hypothetical protein